MRFPRDLSSKDLILALKLLGYTTIRQTGSHIRLTTLQEGEHHLTILNHESLRVGTLNGILGMSRSIFVIRKRNSPENYLARRHCLLPLVYEVVQ